MKPAIAATVILLAATAAARPVKEPKPVHGEGCVQAGVEARCLIVRDMRTGTLYDLLFKDARPPVGLGIEFTGVPHEGPTSCMQGVALDVTSWARKETLKCAPGQANRR